MSDAPSIPSLEELQRWLQAVIMHPGGVQEGSRSQGSPLGEQLENVVPATSKQTSAERLDVYASAYYLRLVDCLREFFPCLRYATGDEIFNEFALAYLQRHPPKNYSLHHLADQFADFLTETKSAAGWEDFFVDLARLEHAIEIIFDAEGPEEDALREPADAVALTPQSSLSFVPGFQLLVFRYPVSSYYTAWKRGDEPPLPAPAEQFVALFRREYIVRRHALTKVQHALLALLLRGKPVEEALARVAPQALAEGQTGKGLAGELHDWFENWTRGGFFRRL